MSVVIGGASHADSRAVTRGHARSRAVTRGHARERAGVHFVEEVGQRSLALQKTRCHVDTSALNTRGN